MRFSILHISDLHRDLRDEVANGPLLDSLARDGERYADQDPAILLPSICIVSGDLVFGVRPDVVGASEELERQYAQAEDFLIRLTDTFFGGDRARVVLLPGNHDVSYPAVVGSAKRVDIPAEPADRKRLTDEYFAPKSRLRWSWSEYCFYRIVDNTVYEERSAGFAKLYDRFYRGARTFGKTPQEQFGIFDYPELGLSVVAFNSCYRNDPLRRAGGFEPTAFSAGCRELRDVKRAGWVIAAAWHHNVTGGPSQDDYLDTEFIQVLIDAGVSIGFHGHQHSHDCVDERYRLGPEQRKMTVVSAGTLCAEPRNLKPGVARGYNVVELNTFTLPVWGLGHFYSTGTSTMLPKLLS
jgi:hypothetical protein